MWHVGKAYCKEKSNVSFARNSAFSYFIYKTKNKKEETTNGLTKQNLIRTDTKRNNPCQKT